MHRSLIGWIGLLVAPSGAWAGDCPTPTAPGDVAAALAAAEASWSTQDGEAVDASVDEATTLARCAAPLAAPLVGRLYRARALQAFLGASGAVDDEVAALLRAGRSAHPGLTMPVSIAPAAHPLAIALVDAQPGPAELYLAPAAEGEVRVDGSPAEAAGTDRPFLFQLVDGEVVLSGEWVGPGDQPAPYAAAPVVGEVGPAPAAAPVPAPVSAPVPAPVPATRKRGALVWVAAATGTALLGTGSGLWVGANRSFTTHCPDRSCPGTFYEDAIAPQRTAGVALVSVGGAVVGSSLVVALGRRDR